MLRFAQFLSYALALTLLTQVPSLAGSGANVSPKKATTKLKEGNERFVSERTKHPNIDRKHRFNTSRKPKPFVTIVGCSDSRAPIEVVFDQGVGDMFVIRVIGNVCGSDQMASVEYGVEHLGTQLVVVLGHDGCEAVAAVVDSTEFEGHLPGVLEKIEPAVAESRRIHPRLEGKHLVPFAVRTNVMQSIGDLLTQSPALHKLVGKGEIEVVGAVYEVETGKVRWLGEHPNLGTILKKTPKDPQQASGGKKAKSARKDQAAKGHD